MIHDWGRAGVIRSGEEAQCDTQLGGHPGEEGLHVTHEPEVTSVTHTWGRGPA